MQQPGVFVRGLARDLFAPLQRPSSPFQSRASSADAVSPSPPSPVVEVHKAPPKAKQLTEGERREEERKKAEEEERQAAYLNGRRLLLPGSGSAGVAKLPQRGIELLWRAYELGHEAALWDLACCVAAPAPASEVSNTTPSSGEEVAYAIDWTLAVPLYEKHAKAGHPIAQKNLGTCYFRGWGVGHNIGKATELYQKASLQNYDVAQYNLGVCYRQGDGVETDPSRMLELYQKAADQGLHAAQCALAKCYLYSRGVPMDWAKATALMTQAADGYPAAMVILARWYEVGYFKLMPDSRKAMEYAIRAVYEKEVDAWDIVLRLLSRFYEEDKRGPVRAPPPSLFSICCDWVYEREIVGQCLVRSQLMTRDAAARRGLSPGMVEREGRLVLQRELRRRERLMRVLPADTQDKLRTDRSVCFSPSCSREFYGGGRVVRRFVMQKTASTTTSTEEDDSSWGGCGRPTLVGLPSSTPVLSRDEVVLHFCGMACATSSLERDAEQTLV